MSVCVILGDPRTDQSGLYDLYTSNPTLCYTILWACSHDWILIVFATSRCTECSPEANPQR